MDIAIAEGILDPITTAVGADVTMVSIPIWLELLAVAVNAAVGVISARKHELDFLGAIFMGLATGLVGGLMRDLILNTNNIYMVVQPLAIPVAVTTSAMVFLFPRVVERSSRVVPFLDILGIGLFAAIGADKALFYGHTMPVCILMGFLTAVGGGMVRDICLARIPKIFQKSTFYALASLGGTVTYLLLVTVGHIEKVASLTACVLVTYALRYISLKFNITTPANVDLTPVVVKPFRRMGQAMTRSTRTTSREYVTERRERVVADIEKRRAKEKDAGNGTSRRIRGLFKRKRQ